MTKVSNPEVNAFKAPAKTAISVGPQRVLMIGQQTGSTYTSGLLVQDVSNNGTEITNFGKDSLIGNMMNVYKLTNQETAIDAIPLDDNGSAVSATGIVAFTGTSTENGTITINVGSRDFHSYDVDIVDTDTATIMGDKLVAAIGADEFALVTAINTTGSVALTAVNGGTTGNNIWIEFTGTVAGASVALTAMSGGLTDPVITNIFDVVGDRRYQTIIFPGQYDESVLTDFLDPRWNVLNNILDGVGMISKTDSVANLKSFLNPLNSQNLTVRCGLKISEPEYIGSDMFELDDVVSSMVGALRALRLTDDSNATSITIASNLDSRGGAALASLPYANTPLFFASLIDVGKGFTPQEIKEINTEGGYVIGNNRARNTVILDKVVTTYKTDVAANPDSTYKFLNIVDEHSVVAEFFFESLKRDYAQSRLTDGPIPDDRNIAGPLEIQSSLESYYNTLSSSAFMITRLGRESFKIFTDSLVLQIDLTEGKVTALMKVPLVSQLRVIDITLEAVLD